MKMTLHAHYPFTTTQISAISRRLCEWMGGGAVKSFLCGVLWVLSKWTRIIVVVLQKIIILQEYGSRKEMAEQDLVNINQLGETERRLKDRLADHRGYVTSKVVTQPTGAHFNLPGHSVANLTVTIIEQVKNKCNLYRK